MDKAGKVPKPNPEKALLQLPSESATSLKFRRRAWLVPSEARALEGYVEGTPTADMRAAAIARARRDRANWKPDTDAWLQLIQLHAFVGKRVRIQFFDGTMYMLDEDEWPDPVEGDCIGVVTLGEKGYPQPFLMLQRVANARTGGDSRSSYLVRRDSINSILAPVADFYEVSSLHDAA